MLVLTQALGKDKNWTVRLRTIASDDNVINTVKLGHTMKNASMAHTRERPDPPKDVVDLPPVYI